jgi:hypothetical protein
MTRPLKWNIFGISVFHASGPQNAAFLESTFMQEGTGGDGGRRAHHCGKPFGKAAASMTMTFPSD